MFISVLTASADSRQGRLFREVGEGGGGGGSWCFEPGQQLGIIAGLREGGWW